MRVLLFLLLALPALAQETDLACPSITIPVLVTGRPFLPPGTRAHPSVTVPLCSDNALPQDGPEDFLHGDPAPQELLRGEGPRNLLTNRYEKSVTVTPAR